jgi:hypothetical protein
MALLKEQKEKGALDLKIPHNFECTTPSFNPQVPMNREDIRKYRMYNNSSHFLDISSFS